MVEIPKKQKAVVFDQPGTVSTKVVEIDVPEPGSGEVLINLFVYPSLTGGGWFELTQSQDTLWRMSF